MKFSILQLLVFTAIMAVVCDAWRIAIWFGYTPAPYPYHTFEFGDYVSCELIGLVTIFISFFAIVGCWVLAQSITETIRKFF